MRTLLVYILLIITIGGMGAIWEDRLSSSISLRKSMITGTVTGFAILELVSVPAIYMKKVLIF